MKKTIFLTAVLLFLPFGTVFAEENPIEILHEKIDLLARDISAFPEDKMCRGMYGDRAKFFFRSEWIGIKSFILDDFETRVSRCYRDEIKSLDTKIEKTLVSQFRKSAMACDRDAYEYFSSELTDIMTLRQSLYADLKKMPEYAKEKCISDSGKFTFTETKLVYNKFIANLKAIKKGIAELKNKLKTNNTIQRDKRSSERAQKFYDDFWGDVESTILGGLYSERSRISANLGGLPDGKSQNISLKENITRENLSDEAKKEQAEKWDAYLDTLQNEEKTTTFLLSEKKREVQAALKRFEENITRMNQVLEQRSDFDIALTNSAIDSLIPFHETLLITTKALEENTKALDGVLNRQNVGVGY